MIFSTIFAVHVPLIIWGVLDIPFFFTFAYTAIVVAMGYELSSDMARTAQLARELKESERGSTWLRTQQVSGYGNGI